MIPAIDDASPGVVVGAAPKPNFDSEPTGSLSDVRLSRVCPSGGAGKTSVVRSVKLAHCSAKGLFGTDHATQSDNAGAGVARCRNP